MRRRQYENTERKPPCAEETCTQSATKRIQAGNFESGPHFSAWTCDEHETKLKTEAAEFTNGLPVKEYT